jgi:hypothetical protein
MMAGYLASAIASGSIMGISPLVEYKHQEKRKKTLALAGIGGGRAEAHGSKGFLVAFFQKSNGLLRYLADWQRFWQSLPRRLI